MKLKNRVALVTGAQQGIGLASAKALAAAGASVVINYLDDRGQVDTAVNEITNDGGRAIAVAGDVANKEAIANLIAAGKEFGGIDILVNNAGIFPRVAFLDMQEEDWDKVHNINLKAGFFCAQRAAQAMIDVGKAGTIVNLASSAAYSGPPLGVHYAASKGGVISMTRAMAMALAPHKIRVNAIAPGLTDTAQPRDGHTDAEIAEMGAKLPLGHIAQPEDIASTVVFLASEESRHITGQVLHVNGGQFFH